MNENFEDQDVLLVKEKGKDELKVAGMDNSGKVSTHKPDNPNNPDFLKIGANDNALQSFFENFARQVKNPTHFDFFRAPAWNINETTKNLQEALRDPSNPKNSAFVDMHRVDPAAHTKNREQQQPAQSDSVVSQKSTPSPAIDPNLVNWDKFAHFGITRETLEKSGEIDKLLDYRKTNLMPVSVHFDDNMAPFRTDARFALRKDEDGTFLPVAHPIRHKPELERPYFGVTFTEEDKKNLLTTGNLGRIVEAEYKQGIKTPILLSLDKQTNELVAFRKEHLKVPETYKGATLSSEQKQKLNEGKAVRVEDMISNKGTKFSADVQFNADKRYFELLFNNDQKQKKEQDNGQKDIPKTFRKKDLTDDQHSSLSEGKTVYTGELLDNKGKKYAGYITLNQETGKLDFMFPKDYKAALAAGTVIPDDRHKTQVAANNEGKTTEATKFILIYPDSGGTKEGNLKEPLKQGQTQPDEKQAEKQKVKEEERKPEKKSKGRKTT